MTDTGTATAPVVRFAPSPTGFLHIGNARPALLNWLFRLRHNGRFILRLDDTDGLRSTEEYAQALVEDLTWLGILPDAFFRQSERFALYDATVERLIGEGRLYPCYETAEELERRRKLQLARGLPPVYDRAALKLSGADRAALEAQGRRPHWRFLLDHKIVTWDDLGRGTLRVDCASLSDPILRREDGTYLYTLPSVVDDIDMSVTHIIRGEDHITNTAVQIQIFEALDGGRLPVFGHHNLLTTASGEGLSKRLGHLSLRHLREAGMEPMAVASLAVLVGSSEPVRPVGSLEELAQIVDIGHLSHAPARFDEKELAHLNARLLLELPYEAVRERLEALHAGGGEEFWLAVRGNILRLSDAAAWWDVVSKPLVPIVENEVVTRAAARHLPPGPWTKDAWSPFAWQMWTQAIAAETGAKGKALFHPLRLALTGRERGPELASLLPLIGHDRARARLEGRAA
ncbi:glutamyl-tRNA synthetase [Pseudochelatococcus lubricantis]|uniref:Glutamate--tRNA ligase n=1 Tax=Pseudochelatococcus lubricantis TaxID=1538102 RepID=A0ABX0UYQ4_9HYPH|nr:glutamate--tRNA ligase [Pseudochelatococcus lubricantis]NIJ58083.1 glutamyl-tRNA synthetase [Pseudochelatococcus lubricantis]